MPIWLEAPEVRAISMTSNEAKPSRPSTYELLLSTLTALSVRVKEVAIEANNEEFKAWINLDGDHFTSDVDDARIPARPADAVVLASLCGAPLYVFSDLFDEAEIQSQPPISEEETLKFKNMLEDLKPADFEKFWTKGQGEDLNEASN